MARQGRAWVALVAAAWLLASMPPRVSAQRKAASPDVAATLIRVADAVQLYFSKAHSIICDETVRIMEVGPDLMGALAPPRIVRNELRVAWEPEDNGVMAPPVVLRNLLSVNGRPPREKDHDRCFDPQGTSPELLGELFLPENQSKFDFRLKGTGRSNGRAAIILDIIDHAKGPVEVDDDDDCVRFGKPGTSQFRAWIDADTADVLRLDQMLASQYDVTLPPNRKNHTSERTITVERADASIVYKPVRFQDPDETVMLPASKDSVQVLRDGNAPRMRVNATYRNYRRFTTGGRIVQ